MNPFQTNAYRGPEYFIDRKNETKALNEAILAGRNITLFSHRRLGKTMLLHHVFAQLDPNNYAPVFVDLFASRNLVHFAQKMTEVLYGQKILHQNRLSKILGSLGASLSFDPLTGGPQVNFNLSEPSSVLKSIPQLFKLLSESKKKVVLAFDEFQEVGQYEEDFAEATLRTLMQEFPDIVFLFSGSRKSMMREIFADANRPFFQSTQLMELHEIQQDIYEKEIFHILDKFKKTYDPLLIKQIMNDTYCHTGFTQMVLSRVFSESGDRIDYPIYEAVWTDILENHKSMAREQEYLLPELQWRLLTAIAREGHVLEPYSHAFISKHRLSAPSSMSRAVKALLDKGLIIDSGDKGLRVYNVFIEKNLKSFPYS
ncbi:MAG: ATP-binding protein [Bacteroidales bacterium]